MSNAGRSATKKCTSELGSGPRVGSRRGRRILARRSNAPDVVEVNPVSTILLTLQGLQELIEIFRQWGLPSEPFLALWMLQAQYRCMQRGSRRTTVIELRSAVKRTIINGLPAEGRSCFGQMDSHLMSASRFQATLNQGEIPQILDNLDMRYRMLAGPGLQTAAAPTVTAVADQPRFNSPRLRPAPNQR